MFEPNYSTKMRNTDRIIVLEPMEGKSALDSKGLTDKRLFTGENKLHAKMDTSNCMWHLEYENGVIPPALQNKWTSFSKLKDHVVSYYHKRNINVKEILD